MLKELYNDKISPVFAKKLSCSVMEVPRLLKVCINSTMKDVIQDSKLISYLVHDISLLAAQKPVITYTKKSVSDFKVRKGSPIGCKVTLRRDKMYQFLERLIYLALPRERDFRGFSSKQFDGNGNMSFGIAEHIIFPEVDYSKIYKVVGMDINIVTTASCDDHAKELLSELGFPFYE